MPRAQNTGMPGVGVDVDAIAAQVIPVVLAGITVYISLLMMYRAMRGTIRLLLRIAKWTVIFLIAFYVYLLCTTDTAPAPSLGSLLCMSLLTAYGSSLLTIGASAVQRAGGIGPLLEQLNVQPARRRSRRKSRKVDAEAALEDSIAEFSQSVGLDKYLDEIIGKKKKKRTAFY